MDASEAFHTLQNIINTQNLRAETLRITSPNLPSVLSLVRKQAKGLRILSTSHMELIVELGV